jgi:hypothetical protein
MSPCFVIRLKSRLPTFARERNSFRQIRMRTRSNLLSRRSVLASFINNILVALPSVAWRCKPVFFYKLPAALGGKNGRGFEEAFSSFHLPSTQDDRTRKRRDQREKDDSDVCSFLTPFREGNIEYVHSFCVAQLVLSNILARAE